MRPPTPEDIKHWARTPIAVHSSLQIDKEGEQTVQHRWMRLVTDSGAVETLEGSPREYYLERVKKGGRTFRLIGVSE